jgi:hypothetical protein
MDVILHSGGFWFITLRRVVDGYKYFGGISCPNVQRKVEENKEYIFSEIMVHTCQIIRFQNPEEDNINFYHHES